MDLRLGASPFFTDYPGTVWYGARRDPRQLRLEPAGYGGGVRHELWRSYLSNWAGRAALRAPLARWGHGSRRAAITSATPLVLVLVLVVVAEPATEPAAELAAFSGSAAEPLANLSFVSCHVRVERCGHRTKS